jgi:hypothetical protein
LYFAYRDKKVVGDNVFHYAASSPIQVCGHLT